MSTGLVETIRLLYIHVYNNLRLWQKRLNNCSSWVYPAPPPPDSYKINLQQSGRATIDGARAIASAADQACIVCDSVSLPHEHL